LSELSGMCYLIKLSELNENVAVQIKKIGKVVS